MSQQSMPLLDLSYVAAGAVTERRAVKFDGTQAAVQGEKVVGVALYAAALGAPLAVRAAGTAVVETGAAVAVGDSLMVDAQGRAIPVTGALAVKAGGVAMTSTAANGAGVLQGANLPEYVFADALEAAAGAGLLIEVLLRR